MIIGVAGHRILTELPVLENAIDSILDRLTALDHCEDWQVLSSLAEGADMLLVERIWQRCPAARLTAVLPLPAEAYREDFPTPAGLACLDALLGKAVEVITPPTAPTRTAAYLAAGLWVAEQCDVLIAIWDGQPPLGEGSTAEVVAYARRLGKPLTIIYAGNRRPGTRTPTSLGVRQGQILYENFAVLEGIRETS